MKSCSQDSKQTGQGANSVPPKWKSEAMIHQAAQLVNLRMKITTYLCGMRLCVIILETQ
jgi:hypothetical protein